AGDLAIIDYEGTVQGKPFSHSRAEGVAVEVGGPAPWPGFSTQLAGLRSGEEREIRVTLPQDYPQGELAGQEAVFHVRVREAKRRELSPLDDEFAKDVSEFETLQELKQDLANRLREDALREAENRVREQVVAKAVEAASLEVPSTLVERRLRSLLADLEARLRQQGLTLE
ncbi:MAG: FKBP-type peptidyl-prolyl cis-trans isomerase, partial [Clostridia bacterium]|nr:FKBP-type peptidyl-prolyl cis-trans isomerase [Clostridia bacterium]